MGELRVDRVAQATRLREEGLMFREIAERMDVPVSTAYDLVADPDMAKHHERMSRHRGTCEDCGAETSWPGSTGAAARRCAACASEAQRIWDRDTVVAAIRLWVDRYGEPPTARGWNPSQAQERGDLVSVARFRAGRWPHTTIVQSVFGSWNAGIEAAGFTPRRSGQRRRGGRRAA